MVLRLFLMAALLTLTVVAPRKATGQAPAAGLKIVIVAGEDAVNIVQQKTAVAPVVEVRDRNDQPVAGAVVRFAIQSGRASFGGARTLTVTTNAVGRAAVTSLTPTGSGALQITASAAFQGQTAAVTIAQTNVLTAAQAATVAGTGGGGGSGGAASGAGGGGAGGGLSATTVGVVGGAAAGGAIVLKQTVLGGGLTQYIGQYSGVLRQVAGACFFEDRRSGSLILRVEVSDNGTVSGNAGLSATGQTVNVSPACSGSLSLAPYEYRCCGENSRPPLTGTTSSLGFTFTRTANGFTESFAFTGAFVGEQIVGTFTESIRGEPASPSQAGVGGSGSYPVTLAEE